MRAFGTFLLYLELIWIGLFISLCTYSFVVTTNDPFGGPMGENMRTDTFALRTHILTFGTILGIQRTRVIWWWVFPVFIFMLFSDTANLVELCCFSPVRDAPSLWKFGIVVSAYQTAITSLGLFWFIAMNAPKTRQFSKV